MENPTFVTLKKSLLKKAPSDTCHRVLGKHTYKNLCVVSDIHTEQAAGLAVYEELEQAGYSLKKVVYQEEELVPDEEA